VNSITPHPLPVKGDAPGCNPTAGGVAAGLARRDAAHDRQEADHAPTLLLARRLFAAYLLEYGGITADDVQDLTPLPPTANPKLFGAVPRPFAVAGWIRRDGYVPSRRPQAHARPVSRWVLADAAALGAWLAHTRSPAAKGVR
jgi:hypothetical protein